MNWLAHFLLADPTPPFRVGSILPDIARPVALNHLPADFQPGIARHHQIDRYTDSHPIVRRSIALFPASLRRYAGILIDIFYDHFLARDWPHFSSAPLPVFVADIYAAFESARPRLPDEIYSRLKQIQHGNWISTYQHVTGIATTLDRLRARLKRPFDLAAAMKVLEQNDQAFHADFNAFFPELIADIARPTI